MMDSLPLGITTDILSKLPVESVFRCRSVCKRWRTLIDDPHFSNLHLLNASTKIDNPPSSFIFIPELDKPIVYILEEENDKAAKSEEKEEEGCVVVKSSEINLQLPSEAYIRGSSNGLLYFHCASGRYICNPATQEYVSLPALHFDEDYDPCCGTSGFWFHPSSGELKVVLITKIWYEEELEVRVYSLGSNSWKKLMIQWVGDNVHFCHYSPTFVNGLVYCLCYKNRDFARNSHIPVTPIVLFDLAHTKMEVVPHPKSTSNCSQVQLGVLESCLCLLESLDNHYEVWVMKDYNVEESWTKQFVIPKLLVDVTPIESISPVCFRKNGELAILCNRAFLGSYNLKSGKFKLLKGDKLPECYLISPDLCKSSFISPDMYKRSLISPYIGSLISPHSVCTGEKA